LRQVKLSVLLLAEDVHFSAKKCAELEVVRVRINRPAVILRLLGNWLPAAARDYEFIHYDINSHRT
jgi:hypothetical protein